MKYPTKIKIKNDQYKIEYVDMSQEVEADLEQGNWLGQCTSDTIRILATQTSNGILETLIHELIHAIFNQNKLFKTALKDDLEESFIDALATELAVIIVENNWLEYSKEKPPITKRINKC